MVEMEQASQVETVIVQGPCQMRYSKNSEVVAAFAEEYGLDLHTAWRDLNHEANYHARDEEFLAVTVDGLPN